MGWEPDLIFLYNDPYIPIPGKRHQWALGAPAREVWKEVWDEHLGPHTDGEGRELTVTIPLGTAHLDPDRISAGLRRSAISPRSLNPF